MDLKLDPASRRHSSESQNARLMTEDWAARNLYCINCGKESLRHFVANRPVADFECKRCSVQYELKSSGKPFGKKIVNGAYESFIERLRSESSPSLILLEYCKQRLLVRNVVAIPPRFFTEFVVEKRRPLAQAARRAGWVGSNILLPLIPSVGLVGLISEGVALEKAEVLALWQKTAFLDAEKLPARGWLTAVMLCVEEIQNPVFSLRELYDQESKLKAMFPKNENIRPKIRQQLQVLRENGYIEFLGKGIYRKLQ